MEKSTITEHELGNLKLKKHELINKLKNKQNPDDLVSLRDVNYKIKVIGRSIRN